MVFVRFLMWVLRWFKCFSCLVCVCFVGVRCLFCFFVFPMRFVCGCVFAFVFPGFCVGVVSCLCFVSCVGVSFVCLMLCLVSSMGVYVCHRVLFYFMWVFHYVVIVCVCVMFVLLWVCRCFCFSYECYCPVLLVLLCFVGVLFDCCS